MKKIFLFVSILFYISAAHSLAAQTTIRMTTSGFEPSDARINQNDSITFINTDTVPRWPASNIHPTHEIYPEFDPKVGIKPGESWTFQFGKAGTWRYHDHLVPQYGGVITVQSDGSPTNTPATQTKHSLWQKIADFFTGLWYRLTHWGKTKPVMNVQTSNSTIDISKYTEDVPENSEKIFSDDIALGSYLKKYGVTKTITALRLLEPKYGSCHQTAHRAGHIGYQLFGNKAFVEYSAECQSGYYHGVMEAYFKEHGADDIKTSLSTLCQAGQNDFFEHQCIHGIGHGIMAWTNYDLPAALKACDELPKRQDSCWTGVFMENFGAKLATDTTVNSTAVGSTDVHYTKYLSSDPQYPCNWVENKYKGSCYFLQTSRMLQIFGVDFKKVAQTCSQAPTVYQNSCFGSMGRDVGGSFPKDMAREISECGYVQNNEPMKIECLNGAVQNSFWDPSGQDLALEFCRLLTDANEKSNCYNTIFGRAPQVIFKNTDLESFCTKAETTYQDRCRAYIPQT